jgi:hypothetical protein
VPLQEVLQVNWYLIEIGAVFLEFVGNIFGNIA